MVRKYLNKFQLNEFANEFVKIVANFLALDAVLSRQLIDEFIQICRESDPQHPGRGFIEAIRIASSHREENVFPFNVGECCAGSQSNMHFPTV